jgi:RNA polymerase sigma-70 factor (ECF subfamily)
LDSTTIEASDEDLMRQVTRGDRAAFATLVERYRAQMMRLAYAVLANSSEAEDVVQETFTRIWTRASGWDPGNAGRFVGWASRIATNLAIDRKRQTRPDQWSDDFDVAANAPDPEAALSGRQIGARIEAALQALPVRQRMAFVLCQVEKMSNGEAAASMDVTVGTLEQLLVRARKKVRTTLADLLEGTT